MSSTRISFINSAYRKAAPPTLSSSGGAVPSNLCGDTPLRLCPQQYARAPALRGRAWRYHPSTYAFYGDDEKHKAYGDVRRVQQASALLRGDSLALASLLGGQASEDPATGGQLVKATASGKMAFGNFVLNDADENGDGTVPVRSGRAPASVAKICTAFPGIDHEGGFKPDVTRRFALWAIARIAQNVKGTSLEYTA